MMIDEQEVLRLYRTQQAGVNVHADEYLDIIEKGIKILSLINRAPGELGFILDCDNYDEYIKTFTDIGGSESDAPYNKEEFDTLKEYYRNVE